MFKLKEYNYKTYSISIFLLVMSFSCIGLFLIQRLQDPGDTMFLKQLAGFAVGVFFAVIVSLIDYHFICKFYIFLYLLNLGMLLFTKYTNEDMGLPVYGSNHFKAKRWIEIKVTSSFKQEFMPSELTKIIMILVLAVIFDLLKSQIKRLYPFLIATVLMAIPTYFVFDQPDLSTSIILVAFFAIMVFAAGVSYKILLPIILIGIPLTIGLFWYVQQDFQLLLDEYQQGRIIAKLHPEEHADDMYQQDNARLAMKSGGTFGKLLLGDKEPRESRFVPVKESDFIFSAFGEEFGVIGMVLFIFGFLLFGFFGLRIAKRARDNLGRLIAIGITSLLTIQAFVNIGVVTSLLPNTGIPLPFVSQGLTSLLTNYLTLGVLLNISMQTIKEPKKDKVIEIKDYSALVTR